MPSCKCECLASERRGKHKENEDHPNGTIQRLPLHSFAVFTPVLSLLTSLNLMSIKPFTCFENLASNFPEKKEFILSFSVSPYYVFINQHTNFSFHLSIIYFYIYVPTIHTFFLNLFGNHFKLNRKVVRT